MEWSVLVISSFSNLLHTYFSPFAVDHAIYSLHPGPACLSCLNTFYQHEIDAMLYFGICLCAAQLSFVRKVLLSQWEIFVGCHSDKRHGLDNEGVGREALIHRNGPPVDKAGLIEEAALDGRFSGRSNWRFITHANKTEL